MPVDSPEVPIEPVYSILLVEDDLILARVVQDYLVQNGFGVEVEERGDKAVKRILGDNPDVVVLDVNLPGLNGFEVCRQIRSLYTGAIIMLTARSEDADEILGLDIGADDYLVKPVRPDVLVARLRVHLRRNARTEARPEVEAPPEEVIRVGELVIFTQRRIAELLGEPVKTKHAEFDLLLVLAQNPGVIVSRKALFHTLNPGERFDYRDRSIDLRISRLRRKLNDDSREPVRIKSFRGDGYMLTPES